SDPDRLLGAEPVDQFDHVADDVFLRIVLGPGINRGPAIAAHVGRDGAKAERRERGQLMTPANRQLGPSVEEKDERSVLGPVGKVESGMARGFHHVFGDRHCLPPAFGMIPGGARILAHRARPFYDAYETLAKRIKPGGNNWPSPRGCLKDIAFWTFPNSWRVLPARGSWPRWAPKSSRSRWRRTAIGSGRMASNRSPRNSRAPATAPTTCSTTTAS